MTPRRIGPRELVRLLGSWPTPHGPAYLALAAALRLLVLDGRLPVGVRLPPERELATTLALSRTTISAAYDVLRHQGHAASRQGSGTWTSLPAGGATTPAWGLDPTPTGVVDLAHAAPPAPPHLHAAYAAALDVLPRHLPDTGYDHRGLPDLRERLAERFTERGLPTTIDQVLITNGALQGLRVALSLLLGPGDRVLVEQPGYPNGLDVVADLGARPVPVPVDPRTGRWDVASLTAAVRQTAPRAAYLIPDFQNPTGALMATADRERVARTLDAAGTVAVIDETLVELALAPGPDVEPFATHAGRTPVITVGSASKLAWGGLRMGWVRSDATTITRLATVRSRQDLASAVLEQLALLHLLGDLTGLRSHRVQQLGTSLDALREALAVHLPDWVGTRPTGGQVLWCELPAGASSSALAVAAQDHGVRLTPGPRFAAHGGLDSWVRLPFTRPAAVLSDAVVRVAAAWEQACAGPRTRPPGPRRPADPEPAYVV